MMSDEPLFATASSTVSEISLNLLLMARMSFVSAPTVPFAALLSIVT